MKVLKSGIEMNPSDLRKVRGGSCACGCGIGYDSENISDMGIDGDLCACGCTTPPDWNAYGGNSSGGLKILKPKG